MSGGNPLGRRITAERILSLGDANRKIAKAIFLVLFDLLVGQVRKVNSVGTIDFSADRFDLLLDACIQIVQKLKIGFVVFLTGFCDCISEVCGTRSTLGPVIGQHCIKGSGFHRRRLHDIDFGVGVRFELVDGDNDIDTELSSVFDVLLQIDASLFQQLDVFFRVFFLEGFAGRYWRTATVHFQGTDGCNNHGRFWFQSAVPALDVEKFFHPDVSPESSLGDTKALGSHQLEGDLVGYHRRVSGGNVGEGSGVDQNGRSFDGLHERRHDGVLHQNRKGTATAQIVGRDGFSLARKPNDHRTELFPQVLEILGQGQRGHDLRRNGNIETSLSVVLNTFSLLFFRLDRLLFALAHGHVS
mmetsp:Transcript_18917/g.38852  ORF Transcript_18917/g.38852 Transcript_18917/m.38852 type:complete len:357 (-) Transcript_18917:784-1854(-)